MRTVFAGGRGAYASLAFGIAVTLLVGWELARGSSRSSQGTQNRLSPAAAEPGPGVRLPPFSPAGEAFRLRRINDLHTDIRKRPRVSILEYSVQPGDTAWSIAEKFSLQPETILWGNEGLSAEAGSLQIGQALNILPVDGVLYTVQEGDTLERLQALYDVPAEVILEFPGNGLDAHQSVELTPGQHLIIPGAVKSVAWVEPGPPVLAGMGRRSPGFYSGPLVYFGSGFFQWPVSPVRLTQSYWSGHPGIDLDTYLRQPVFSSDSGTVIFSEWDSTGYGNLVIIDHGNGFWTYYAHNEANLVRPGDGVLQGQQIAESGSTGNSTGEHLDFRIRLDGGAFLNPLDFLP